MLLCGQAIHWGPAVGSVTWLLQHQPRGGEPHNDGTALMINDKQRNFPTLDICEALSAC